MKKIREISAMLCLCLLMHPVSAAAEEPEVTKEPEATPHFPVRGLVRCRNRDHFGGGTRK